MLLRSWGLGRLVASWFVYWVLLLAVVLAPVARRYYEVQRSDAHGMISFDWSGSGRQMILIVVGPPLLMTLLWIASRPRRP
jgi:hypothetical protein